VATHFTSMGTHRGAFMTVFGSYGINLPIRLPEEAVPNVVYFHTKPPQHPFR
jgi:hypothetical protein